MALKVYNTLTGKKEPFEPREAGKVGMYVCGVTVYDLCHVGHARAGVVFDMIYRCLVAKGFETTYVRNFTDVDDKIIDRAAKRGISCKTLSGEFIEAFHRDMGALGLAKPTHEPKATGHIAEIVSLIERLIEKGYAYESRGDVLYSVKKFKGYGKLSGKRIEELESGARVAIDEKKRDPLDFALWKASKPGEPTWESPWGPGRPGWHIECSAMSMKFLGETFDIHGGGRDLAFPHHENEIAQSEAATGKPFVRYWIHNGFVNIDKEKMSKSLGNFLTVRDILEERHPEELRAFLLSAHYRSPLDFTDSNLDEAAASLEKMYETLGRIDRLLSGPGEALSPERLKGQEAELLEKVRGLPAAFEEALDDDFNSARALGALHAVRSDVRGYLEGFKKKKKIPPSARTILSAFREVVEEAGAVLGLWRVRAEEYFGEKRALALRKAGLDGDEIDALVRERAEARAARDWTGADAVRDKLASLGVVLEDGPEGTTWRVEG